MVEFHLLLIQLRKCSSRSASGFVVIVVVVVVVVVVVSYRNLTN